MERLEISTFPRIDSAERAEALALSGSMRKEMLRMQWTDWTGTGLMAEISEYLRPSTVDLHLGTVEGEGLTEAEATADVDPDLTADPDLDPGVDQEADAPDLPVVTGPIAEVLEGPRVPERPPRAPGGPEAGVPEPPDLEVLRGLLAGLEASP